MIIAAIIIGIIILFLMFLTFYISYSKNGDFDGGVSLGMFLGMFIASLAFMEVFLIICIIGDPRPTAMDVYQGKTTLEYKVVDDVKVDSVVILKNDYYGSN